MPSFLFFILVFLFVTAEAVIDEGFDRHEPYEISDPIMLEAAKKTAALIAKSRLVGYTDQMKGHADYKVLGIKAVDSKTLNFCPDEPFASQESASSCSGVLIAPDVILTAGHCINEDICENAVWVFNYKASKADQNTDFSISANDVYHCMGLRGVPKNLAAQHNQKDQKEKTDKLDYAFIQLDRPVNHTKPAVLDPRPISKMSARYGIYIDVFNVSHPWGLPQKIIDNGKLFANSWLKKTFDTRMFAIASRLIPAFDPQKLMRSVSFGTLDIAPGSSGSGVFNSKNGKLVGLVVAIRPKSLPLATKEHKTNSSCKREARNSSEDAIDLQDTYFDTYFSFFEPTELLSLRPDEKTLNQWRKQFIQGLNNFEKIAPSMYQKTTVFEPDLQNILAGESPLTYDAVMRRNIDKQLEEKSKKPELEQLTDLNNLAKPKTTKKYSCLMLNKNSFRLAEKIELTLHPRGQMDFEGLFSLQFNSEHSVLTQKKHQVLYTSSAGYFASLYQTEREGFFVNINASLVLVAVNTPGQGLSDIHYQKEVYKNWANLPHKKFYDADQFIVYCPYNDDFVKSYPQMPR